MQTKLQTLKDYMAAGNHTAALKLAASWGKRGLGGGTHAEAITQAHSANGNRRFYESIGKNPDELVAKGIQAIRERYGIK